MVQGAPCVLHAGRRARRIEEVAEQARVNFQTLRYYERRGLLPDIQRLPSGYRAYAPSTVALARFIRNAQDLGFTLREIAELRERRSQSQLVVRRLAMNRIDEVDRRIRDLTSMRNDLAKLVEECQSVFQTRDCVILEAIDLSATSPNHSCCSPST